MGISAVLPHEHAVQPPIRNERFRLQIVVDGYTGRNATMWKPARAVAQPSGVPFDQLMALEPPRRLWYRFIRIQQRRLRGPRRGQRRQRPRRR